MYERNERKSSALLLIIPSLRSLRPLATAENEQLKMHLDGQCSRELEFQKMCIRICLRGSSHLTKGVIK